MSISTSKKVNFLTPSYLENETDLQKKQYKVVLKNFPFVQKHKWSNQHYRNSHNINYLERIAENSLEVDDSELNYIDDQSDIIEETKNEDTSIVLKSSNKNSFDNCDNLKEKKFIQSSNSNILFSSPNDKPLKCEEVDDSLQKNKIIERQRTCEWISIILIFLSFGLIFCAVIVLFLIAFNTWYMATTFTIVLISLCISTVLLVLLASVTANFFWYYNSDSKTIDWMLHYGSGPKNHYFGKSFKESKDNNPQNETTLSLIEKI